MEKRRCWCLVSLVFNLVLLTAGESMNASSLDTLIRDYAFRALLRRRTGVLYPVPLPANLSGITVSVIRMRSASLWSRGLDSSAFHIPSRTMTVPFVRRLVVVYIDMGNWSSTYYDVPGYSLDARVFGCLAYDASNVTSGIRELDLRPIGDGPGDHISVIFPGIGLDEGKNSTMRCVRFGNDGSVRLGDTMSSNVCDTKSTGHFTIVVPSVAPAPAPVVTERGDRRWRVWVIAGAGVVVGLLMVILVVVGFVRLSRKKKREDMEIHAERGEALGSMWVGDSQMPCATMVRTQPVIENGNSPD